MLEQIVIFQELRAMSPLSLPKMLGPYRIDCLIGSGGMGEVYRGYDPRLDRLIALKRIKSDQFPSVEGRERFKREGRALARVSHPRVVQVYDWLESEDGDWLVMEFVRGQALNSILEEQRLGLSRSLEIASDIASGLAAIHQEGIVHRDLKPKNVMILEAEGTEASENPDGRVKIVDFGLAKRVTSIDGMTLTDSISKFGQVLGTVLFMSPEQAAGRRIDGRSDIFSLGIILYSMLSGRLPFVGETPLEVLMSICTELETPLHELDPSIPEGVSRLVRQMLRKAPEQRFQSASAACSQLQELRQRAIQEPAAKLASSTEGEHEFGATVSMPGVEAWPTLTDMASQAESKIGSGADSDFVALLYGPTQAAWVEDRLIPILKAARLRVHHSSYGPVGSMKRALPASVDRTIIVLSAADCVNRNFQEALLRGLARDPEFSQGSLVPVYRESMDPPESLASHPAPILLEHDESKEGWKDILDACQAETQLSPPEWLAARDDVRRFLTRHQSVCLVVFGKEPWRLLIQDLRRTGCGLERLVFVDLDRPATHTLEGFVMEIFLALGSSREVSDPRAPLLQLQEYLEAQLQPPVLALMHFDRAKRFDGDFFAALRYFVDQRQMILLFQTRQAFVDIVPADDPLSKIDLKTIELGSPV